MRSRILIPVIYLVFGLYFSYRYHNLIVGIIFTVIAVLWFVFYPKYSGWRYKKHFQKHVKENYKNRIGIPVELEFDEAFVYAKEYGSESKIKGSEIKELIEIKDHYFLKLSTGLSLIIPKHAVTNHIEFKNTVTKFGTEHLEELNWKWK